jgi:hypothetical protein
MKNALSATTLFMIGTLQANQTSCQNIKIHICDRTLCILEQEIQWSKTGIIGLIEKIDC